MGLGGIEGGRTELELCHSGGRREGGQEISQEAVAMIRAQSERLTAGPQALPLSHVVRGPANSESHRDGQKCRL